MKKCVYLFALCFGLFLLNGCSSGSRIIVYALHNQTDKDVTFCIDGANPSVIAPNEYYVISRCLEEIDGEMDLSIFWSSKIYLTLDGVRYQVDRNDSKGCLWKLNYHPVQDAEIAASLRTESRDGVCIFELTEDYIMRQIPVSEE